MLKHCLSLKTFIPNFVAFLVSLGTVIYCIRKMSFPVTSAKREFTPAGHCFISDFKIGQLRTTDDGEHGRGPGSRLPAHAHFGVSSVLCCVVARDGVFSRIFV